MKSKNIGDSKIIKALLYVGGVFCFLVALSCLSQSAYGSICFVIVGLLLLPSSWKILASYQDKMVGDKVRALLVICFFVAGIIFTPTSIDTKASIAMEKTDVPTKVSTVKQIDKKQSISNMKILDGKYKIVGTGSADTGYKLVFSNGSSYDVTTNSTGDFSVELPTVPQTFGDVELVKDTNGFLPGGEESCDKNYFTVVGNGVEISKTEMPIVVLGIGSDSGKYEMSGFYDPGATLTLKGDNNKVIASTVVDNTGRYQFNAIDLGDHYTKVSLYKTVQTGWFKSEDNKIAPDFYIDKQNKKTLKDLPITKQQKITKEKVAFSSTNIYSAYLSSGSSQITQAGVNGEKTIIYDVTYRGDQVINTVKISESITKEPVTQITTIGTYVAPAQTPTYQLSTSSSNSSERTGAICSDGWHSPATGRGACSHHGGVSRWLY